MCQNKICLIYQYLLFNADRLKREKEISLDRLKRSKDISAEELCSVYSAVLKSDIFEDIAGDLFRLLNF